MRRWVGRTLRELWETVPKELLWVLDEIQQLLDKLPPEGSWRLFELWKQVPERRCLYWHTCAGAGGCGQSQPLSTLSQLQAFLIRMSEHLCRCRHWASYPVFDWDLDEQWYGAGDWTDENAQPHCGGYKSWLGSVERLGFE